MREPFLVIKPKKGWQLIDFQEIREHKDLLYLLIARDIKVRYKQTVLGGLWAIIQPFLMMVIFTLFFGKLAGMPSEGVPYPIFNYAAMVAWTYFAGAIINSSNSLVQESSLISKVFFPRMIIPLAPVIAGLLDFGIAFIVLGGMMIYYGIYPNLMIIFLPLLIVLMILTATGVGTFLSALNARYRDVRYTVAFMVQFWMFATPIIYPFSLVPEKYRALYSINPMTGIIEGFRSALLGTGAFPYGMVATSAAVSILIFVLGVFYFKQTERYFSDVI